VRIEAELDAPGFVVFVSTHDPGWQATVDGAPAPLLRANLAFCAVAVPAGRHVVELVYRPSAVLWSAAASAAGWALLALAGAWGLRNARRES
jgi:MYXO-CTERM domain-containing protein